MRMGVSPTEWVLLKASGGDPIRADELRARITHRVVSIMMLTYLPMVLAVGYLFTHRPAPLDIDAQADRKTAVEAFAARFVDAYLQAPFDADAMSKYCISEIPMPAADRGEKVVAPGGRAVRVSSTFPGGVVDGFETWSVIVQAAIPQSANSAVTTELPLQVNVSVDRHNLFCAVKLPNNRVERSAGMPVELTAQIQVAEDRPVYSVVKGFLMAMLLGQGDVRPYVSSGSRIHAPEQPQFATLAISKVVANSEDAAAQDVPPKSGQIEVLADVIVQTSSGIPMPMEFPLLLSVASGHWQVDEINDSPSITVPESGDTSTTAPTANTPRQPANSSAAGGEK